MNKFVYFLAVGLAFTVLQAATVEAQQDTAAGLVTGGNAPADCGGVPCPTGDDAHTGGAQDCANLKEADGSAASPDAVAACHARQSSHANSAHAGMAPGTTAMCPGPLDTMIPCTTGDANMGTGGQGDICSVNCAGDGNVPAAAVASCVAEQTAANCNAN